MMKYLWIILPILLGISRNNAQASWGVGIGAGSYLGERHVGAVFESQSKRHQTEISFGETDGILGDNVHQLNLRYLYSPLSFLYRGVETNLLGIGAMITRCLCDEMFVQNSDAYPTSDYYDQTAYRFGVVVSTEATYKNFQIYWDWTLLDQRLIILFNNTRYTRHAKGYLAGGFGLRYIF